MSCEYWQSLVLTENVDEMAWPRRRDVLSHLRVCSACRDIATAADPTLIFYLLLPVEVQESEVEDIRHTVQSLRRVKALRPSPFRRARRGLAVGGFAALTILALGLIPQRPVPQPPLEIPFAGAVGVGTGLMDLSSAAVAAGEFDLRMELLGIGERVGSSGSAAQQTVSLREVTVRPGEQVERDLGEGYRVRFRVAAEASGETPSLEDFRWTRVIDLREVLLFQAESVVLPEKPWVMESVGQESSESAMRLLLTRSGNGNGAH